MISSWALTKSLMSELAQDEAAVGRARTIACKGEPWTRALVCRERAPVDFLALDGLEVAGKLDDRMRCSCAR